MFFQTAKRSSVSTRTVSDDWICALPREKSQTFDLLVASWESVYAMMSVSLDDSLSLRSRGELVCARQQIGVTAELFDRISATLVVFCDTVCQHSRHVRSFPAVEPLNMRFFRGAIGQRAAYWHTIVHRVLFGDRSKFNHKVRVLWETLQSLREEFQRASLEITRSSTGGGGESWKALDCVHYDFNTCLRENEILLKSFLRALPNQHLCTFARDLGVVLPSTSVAPQATLSGASA